MPTGQPCRSKSDYRDAPVIPKPSFRRATAFRLAAGVTINGMVRPVLP
jgi:hypothetical protein